MPPLLAAFACSAFILWLLYRDAKGPDKVSGTTWIATLWITIIASKPVAVWFSGRSDDLFDSVDSGSTLDRNVFLALIFCACVILNRRRFSWGGFFSQNRWLLLFYLFMFVSVFWSDYPFVSFKRWIRVAGNVLVILVLLTEHDPVHAIRKVFVRSAFLLVPLSLLVIKYYPSIGVYFNFWTGEIAYCGVTTDKNGLGRLAWVSGLFLLWSIDLQKDIGWLKKIRRRPNESLVLVLCIMLLLKSHSATSLACFLVVSAAYFASRADWVRRSPRLLAFGACAFVCASLLFLAIPDLRSTVTSSLGRDPNLTDRTEIWQRAFDLNINPLFGEGFASFWMTPTGQRMGLELQVNEAHNGYLETYLNSGLIGLLLLVGVLFRAGSNALNALVSQSPLGVLYAPVFLGGVLYNYTETAINDTSLVGFLILMVAVTYRPHT